MVFILQRLQVNFPMKQSIHFLLPIYLLSVSIALSASAATPDTTIKPETETQLEANEQIETLVVSATRFAVNSNKTPLSVNQLDEQTMQLVGHRHIQELLLRVPGINLHRGDGQEYLPALRSPVLTGAGACGSILTAEDGIALRAAGFCNINELFEAHTEQAQSIEVIRGPGASIYGSNALHGVINVLTPLLPLTYHRSLGVELGPDHYSRLKLGGGYSDEHHAVGTQLSTTHSDSFRHDSGYTQQKLTVKYQYQQSAFEATVGMSLSNLNQETAGFIEGKDAYKNRSLARQNENPEAFRDAESLRIWSRFKFTVNTADQVLITPYARYTRMDFFQHFLPGTPLEKNGQKSLGLQTAWHQELSSSLTFINGLDAEFTKAFLQQDQQHPTTGSTFLQATIPQGNHYDYEVDATNLAAFTLLNWTLNQNLAVQAGLRYDSMRYNYNNLALDGRTRDDGSLCGFGGCRYSRPSDRIDTFHNWSPKLGVNYQILPHQFAFLNLSRGFRAPQATELYRLQREQTVASLDSEHLDSLEIGLKGSLEQAHYQLAFYFMKKENVIFRDSNFFNIADGQTEHKGVELQFQYKLRPDLTFSLNANFARHYYNHSRQSNGINLKNNDIDTAPRYFGNTQLQWQPYPEWLTELEWVYVSRYYLDPENLHKYPGHDLFNLRIRWSPSSTFETYMRISNLADTRYAERADYTQFSQERYFPGLPRTMMIGLQWRWE